MSDADDFLKSLQGLSLGGATATIGKKRRPPRTKMPNAVHVKGGLMAGLKGGTTQVNVTIGNNGVQVQQTHTPSVPASAPQPGVLGNLPNIVYPGFKATGTSQSDALAALMAAFNDTNFDWKTKIANESGLTGKELATFNKKLLSPVFWEEIESGGQNDVDFETDVIDWANSSGQQMISMNDEGQGWDQSFEFALDTDTYDSRYNIKVWLKQNGDVAISDIYGD